MKDAVQIIGKSPFVKSPDNEDGFFWSLEAKDPATGKFVEASLHPDALMDSLGAESGETDLWVCGCSDAGCAGFANEKFETADKYVHWSFTEYRQPYSLYFDRQTYEVDAVKMLHEIYVSRIGWKFNAICYNSYDEFKTAVDNFLEAKPHFMAIWSEIEEKSAKLKGDGK